MSSDLCLNRRQPGICYSQVNQSESSSTVYTNEKTPGYGISSYEDPALIALFEEKNPEVIKNCLNECYNGALSSLKKAPYDPCINLDILLQCAYHTSPDVRIAAGQYLAKLHENSRLRDRVAEDVVRTMCVLDFKINAKVTSSSISQSSLTNSPGRDSVLPPVQFMQIVKDCLDDQHKNIAWERLKDLCIARPGILKDCRWIAKFRLNFNQCLRPDDIFRDTSSSSLSGSVIQHITDDCEGHDVEEKSFCLVHSWDEISQGLMDSMNRKYTKFVNDTQDQLDLDGEPEQDIDLHCPSEKESILLSEGKIQTKGNDELTEVQETVIKVVRLPCSNIVDCNNDISGNIVDKKSYMKEKIETLRQGRQPVKKIIQEPINNLSNGSFLSVMQETTKQEHSNKIPPPPPLPPILLNVPQPPPPPESHEPKTDQTVSKNDPEYIKQLIEQRSVHNRTKKGKRRATDPADKNRSNGEGKQERSLTVPERTTGNSPEPSRLSSINESGPVEGDDPTSKTLAKNKVGVTLKETLQKLNLWRKT